MTPLLKLQEAAEAGGLMADQLIYLARSGKRKIVCFGPKCSRYRPRDFGLPEEEPRDVALGFEEICRILRMDPRTARKHVPFKQCREPELAAWIEERVR